ncbi:MAG: hypothetical protein JSW66_19570 [Phycisphaerales bacterium]|nr:MAG: hypothetical protein JSW66_19570 [Phycisphaerales bacterium]
MKRVMSVITILVLAVSFAGCSKPSFYQAGKTAAEREHDLQQCIHEAETYGYTGAKGAVRPATLINLCMQAKGYQYLDADKLPQRVDRVKVFSFADYWLTDSSATVAADDSALAENVPQASAADTRAPECIGYKAQRDEAGKLVLIPVYETEQVEDTDSQELADSGE